MQINVPEDIVERLEQLAQQQGRSVGELVELLLNRYAPETPPGSLAEMAQNARDAALASETEVSTADDSRAILRSEYADYLKRRLEHETDVDNNG